MRLAELLLLVVVLQVATPQPAHAYVDPAAGSLAVQVAFGIVLGGFMALRRWRAACGQAIKSMWSRIRRS
jgi:hypothetical protein